MVRMRSEWAKRVRAARLAKGWTQRELGTRAQASQQTVGAIESGVGCSDEMKIRIAAALGENPADLFPLVVDSTEAVA